MASCCCNRSTCFRVPPCPGHYVQDYIGDSGDFTALPAIWLQVTGTRWLALLLLLPRPQVPGYPAFLALAFVFNNSHGAAVVLNALLGAVATFLVYLISRALN